MSQLPENEKSKDPSVKAGLNNNKDNNVNKERIQRLKKNFLPSWNRGTHNSKPKLSSSTNQSKGGK